MVKTYRATPYKLRVATQVIVERLHAQGVKISYVKFKDIFKAAKELAEQNSLKQLQAM